MPHLAVLLLIVAAVVFVPQRGERPREAATSV